MNSKRFKIILSSVLMVIFFIVMGLLTVRDKGEDLGIKVVELMYKFPTPEELATVNSEKLENIVTEEVMKDISINNENLLKTSYYSFRLKPTDVEIVESNVYKNNGSVKFKIINENITISRTFLLLYEIENNLVSRADLYEVQEMLK